MNLKSEKNEVIPGERVGESMEEERREGFGVGERRSHW